MIGKIKDGGTAMETLYADIYFLINFTVDILSLHFAAAFAKVPISKIRLILLSSAFSGLSLLFVIFVESLWITVIGNLVVAFSLIFASARHIGVLRRFKLALAFYALMTLIGGIVTFIYNLIFEHFPMEEYGGGVNRGLLLVALTILLAFGVIKMLLFLFSGSTAEKYADVELELLGCSVRLFALIDSGNLLRDPMDSTPVMLIKERAARELFSGGIPDLKLGVPKELEKYVRIIPTKGKSGNIIEYGIRPRAAYVYKNKRKFKLRIIFIIDYEEGSFGGYDGLIGTSALGGIV